MAFNKLSPAEAERLALLLEELGEAQQAIGKILRHGYDNRSPFEDDGNNRNDLCKEIGHVYAAVHLMVKAEDISHNIILEDKGIKLIQVKKYLHHQ